MPKGSKQPEQKKPSDEVVLQFPAIRVLSSADYGRQIHLANIQEAELVRDELISWMNAYLEALKRVVESEPNDDQKTFLKQMIVKIKLQSESYKQMIQDVSRSKD